MFTANAEGEGEAEASNDQSIPDGDAGSIVVHSAEEEGEAMEHGEGGEAMEHSHSHSDKVACAELEGGSAPEAAAEEGDAMKHEGDAMKHEGDDAMKHKGDGTTIVVRNGEPVGGVQELEYSAGDEIRFRVSSNRADEVHVHGYDVEKAIPAGGSATLSFPAEIEGIFEVELHESEAQIAELRVNP